MSETKTYTWDGNIQDVCALLRQAHDMLSLASYPSGFKRRWVGLTDEERKDLCRSWSSPMDAIYATEAKLKEKNT
jgi:hypothetical protein